MLAAKQQWCPRCQRHVQTEQKRSGIGRQKKLVKITVTCGRCRITLTSKTTSAAALAQQENEEENSDV
jgi:C4-type Zn-finger protein